MAEAPDRRSSIILPRVKCISDYKKCVEEYVTRSELSGFNVGSYTIRRVKNSSRKTLRSAAHTLAVYFRREFGYDFVQYSMSDPDCNTTVYLFCKEDMGLEEVVGGVCLRYSSTEYPDKTKESRWWLDWAWFHPYHRRKGLLSQLIPVIKKDHPRCLLAYPLSKGMSEFDKKHQFDERHREEVEIMGAVSTGIEVSL